jgi:phage terminase large subunit
VRWILEQAPLEAFADHPLWFSSIYWPDSSLYDRQEEILLSVRDVPETVVVAAHQVGKDYTAARAVLWYYTTRTPCRVVTTSIRDDHLRVLFGEVGRLINTCRVPLLVKHGGPLIVNHREIKKVVDGKVCPISYLIGMVSEKGEGMQGHHAAHTLFVADEASGIDDVVFERAATWAKRSLIFGNAYGSGHWFYKAAKGGDIRAGERHDDAVA